jgi:hypothetical protein
MNFEFDAVMFLALFTLGAGLVIGIISFTRAKRAQDHHKGAAVAERQSHEDPRADVGGTPGNIDPTVSEAAHDGKHAASRDAERTWSEERGANPPTRTSPTPMPPRN